MPDFDKDLRPIIKDTSSPDFTVDARGVRNTPMPMGSATATPDLSETPSVFDKLNMYASQTKTGTVGAFVSNAELAANKRYATYNPTLESQEDFAAYGQSGWDKAINGTLKGTNLAATTVAGGFAALGGLLASPFTGKLSTIWDNPVMNTLDKWNEKVDNELLPNYYTDIEKDAAWYSTDNWMTTNFLFDKFIKNAGFAVGAMYGGNIANAGLLRAGLGLGKALSKGAATLEAAQAFTKFTPYLRNAARAVSVSENLKAYEILASKIGNIAELEANAVALGESAAKSAFGEIATSTNKFNAFNDAARRAAIATYSSGGEASFEALQTSKALRENLIQDYKDSHGGLEPEGKDLDIIESNVSSIGKASFLGNLAVLAFTENLQLPKLLGSSYSASRQVATSLVGKVDDVVKRDGVWGLADLGPTTKFGKVYSKATGVGKYIFDPKEAGQEGLQYALQVGAQNYYNKAYRTDDANFLIDGVLHGLEKTLTDKEGIEGMILGGLTGGPMQAMGTYKEGKATATNTQAFLQDLTGAGDFKDAFVDRMNSINRAIVLQQQQQDAVLNGDKLEAKDLEADQMHNYIATRIKYGRYDMVKQDIDELRRMSMTTQGLEELKAQGIGNINDDIESFQKRLNEFEKVAAYTNELYKSTNLAYSGVTNKDGSRKYGDDVIDKMVYAASKIADYDVRIPEVNTLLSDYGIATSEVLDLMFNKGKSNKQATKEALAKVNALEEQIDELDTIKTIKDELKTQLSDVMEMSARRKLYLSEYDEMVNDPEYFTLPDSEKEVELAKIKQIKETEDGKKKSIPVDIEVGKEYSLTTPVVRDGNKLKANPKIKVLSKTLGGEYEVQLPSGEITFLKPEGFKQFNISFFEIEDKEASDLLEKAISNVLARPEFENTPIPDAVGNLETPQEASLADFLNASNNEALTDAVEAEFGKIAEDYLKEKEEEVKKRELLKNVSGEITKLQNEENNLSAFVPTPDSSVEEIVKSSDVEPNLKDAEKIFSSTSSKSVEDSNDIPDFVTRFNKFMNSARNFKNRSKLQAIMFTYNQQKALGLDGVVEMAWQKQAGQLEGKALTMATDPINGNVMVVFVQVDKGGKQSFIDADGNVIGEVGQQVDVNKVVVSNMAKADLKVGGYDRYRQSQKQEAENYLRAWETYREGLFKPNAPSRRFSFTISKGKPMINESAPENNSVAGTLVSEEVIAKEKVLEVNTKDVISHPDGNNYSVPVGRPYIVFGDMLQIVNNNQLTSNQAKTTFSLLKELADTLIGQAAGERIVYDVNKRIFLRNTLFMNDQGEESNNKVFLRAGNLHIGSKVYDLTTLGKFEKEITNQLQTVYHTVNNKTLNGGLAKSFVEYYTEDGEIKTRTWKNYQSYLLSGKNPDGSARNANSIPVTTSVNKTTEAVPYNYTRKYVTLDGLELAVEKIEKPVAAKAEPTTGAQVFPSKSGDVAYTVTNGTNGLPIVKVSETDPTVVAVAKDKTKLATIKEQLIENDAFDDLDSAEEMVARYYSVLIQASIIKSTTDDQAPVADTTIVSPDKIDLSDGDEDEFYSVATEGPYEKMTQYDMDAFKEWAQKNLPVMLYEYVDNALRTTNGREAFGKLEKGVAYIMKTGARGTEYHEAFHFVFNGFLSKPQRQEILDEFKSRAGSFTDRASGKTIDYVDATDLQAEEKIADDFAAFRLGKLPARTLSEKVLNFFKGIIDFFKSIVTKKGKIDELFDAIETGQFAERSYPDSLKRVSTRYSEIPGMSEQEINEAVQDITSRIFSRVFSNNESLFNPEKFTSRELFSEVKESTSYYRNASDAKWAALVKRTKDFLKTYRIEFDENSAIGINDENASKNEYAADSFTVDYKKSSPYAVKLLIGTLVKAEPMDQTASMGLTLPAAQKSSIKGAKLVPFNSAFATLLNHFENVKNPNVFVEKLVDLAREKSEYVRLFTRLKGTVTREGDAQVTPKIDFSKYSLTDWRLFISTFQVFTKQKPEAIKQFLKDNVVYTGSAIQIGSVKEIQDDWINNMIIGSEKEGALVKKTGNYYTIRKNDFKENGKDYVGIAKQSIDNPARMIEFLNKLGVTFTLDQHRRIKDRKKFSDAVASIKKGLTGKSSPDTVNSLTDRRLDISTGLKELAKLYSQATSTATTTVLLNSEGDQRQEFTESNAPSYFEYMFNSVNSLTELKQKMPQLNDVFSKNSELLREGGRFFDENGDRTESKLKVQYIDGEENLNNGTGRSTSSLSIGDRFTAEINQNIDGNYYVLIPADGSTEWMMNMGNQIDYELFSDGESGLTQAYEIFQKYLIDEINLAKDWKNREKLRLVGDKAKSLRFFEKILSKDLVNKAEKIINNANSTEADINNFIAENTEDINKSVKEYIDATVVELKESLISNNQVTVSKNGKYTYMGLLSSFAGKNSPYGLNKKNLSEDQFNNILTFVNTNYIINNIEYHKVLFGDPYQFKIKDGILDETKRIKSFLSPRRFTFNMTEYNNKLNSEANTVDGNLLTDKDYGYHEFKDYLKTITASDVNLVSSLAKLFRAYGGTDAKGKTITINETDASSWISPTAYREVKMKNGQWSDEAEAFHQWQMAYTRQNIPGYKYSNLALQAHDIELVKKPMPKYFIEVLKPIVSGNKFNKNTIDLVLDKFSQVPLYYSAVKGTNLQSLFEKMFKEKVDYVVVESGRKVGAENLVELYNGNGSFNEEAFGNSIEVPWDAYGIQVENSYDKEKLQTRGSQLNKLATLDLYSEGQPVGVDSERQEVIKNAVERNAKALDNLVEQGYNALLKKLGIVDNGDGTFQIVDKSATAELLRQSMFNQQMSANAIDSVTLNDKGEFEIPFEASTNYTQIKNILYSAVNKSVISPKMSGFPGVQISAAMWESSSEGRQLVQKNAEGNWENISKEDYEKLDDSKKKKVRFTSSALKFYEDKDENGKNMRYCEVLLPNWIRKSLPANMTDEQAIKYLKGVDGGKILRGIGFRIPTQALSSVEVFEIKGFLPEYMGRSVVVPSEITTKAGSDFDIDKLNMYLRAIYTDAQGDVRLVQSKGSEEETKSFYRKVYEDTIQAELDKLSEYDDFRNVLVDILEKLERLPNTDSETILASLSEDDIKFYATHQNMLQAIVNQANDGNVLPSDYMKSQIEMMDDKKDEVVAKLLNAKLRNDFVESMYAKSLENEYYDSLEEILTLPENFARLVSPNTDATLKELAKEIDTLEGIDETSISNPMLNRNYMTNLRSAFLTAKKWVGIAAVNITGNSLAQKVQVFVKDPTIRTFLPHNITNINGMDHMTLSKSTDKLGKYISDKLSEYANAFVDVAKDPYILKIIYSNRIVGSFMVLERLGVPTETSALFMNQPIIKKYIKYLDSTNQSVSAITNKANLDHIGRDFKAGKNFLKQARTILSEGKDLNETLRKSIENYAKNTKAGNPSSELENAMQHIILNEFLMINDLASANYKMSQAINYDTTRFKNGDELYRKNLMSDIAKEQNVFSGIDEILNMSFIGKIKKALNNSTKALGEVLKFNQDEYRDVIEDVLEYYAISPYVSNDKFNRIADKASASFLDYIIYTKGTPLNLKELLVDSNSVANRMLKVKERRNDIKILDYLSVAYREGATTPTKTLKLRNRTENAFDENMLIGYMREMRNDPDPSIVNLYNDIVKVAITQGNYRTSTSIKSIVPLEDYAKQVAPIINNLVVDEDIRNFAKSNWFQKNYFNDADVAVEVRPTFWPGKRVAEVNEAGETKFTVIPAGKKEEAEVLAYGEEDIYVYFSPSILTNDDLKASYDNRSLIRISASANTKGAGANVVVIPRIIPRSIYMEGDVDFTTGLTVPPSRYAQLRRELGEKINEKFGYEKVVDKAGNPVFDYDDNGNPYYIYRAVNLYGDPGLAVEYNLYGNKSALDNNTREVDEVIPVESVIGVFRNSEKIGADAAEESSEIDNVLKEKNDESENCNG